MVGDLFQLDSGRGEQVQIAHKCSISKKRSFSFYQNKFSEFPYLCRSIRPFPPPWPPQGSPAGLLAPCAKLPGGEGLSGGQKQASKVRQAPSQ